MTQKEQARLQVLNSLLAEHMTPDQAATLMGVTTRHTRRILAAYREKGVEVLKLMGKKSKRDNLPVHVQHRGNTNSKINMRENHKVASKTRLKYQGRVVKRCE